MDSTFLFGKWTKDGGTETHVRYLGQFETNFGRSYKAFNWTWIWGQSQRATSRILFFDNSNSYIGHFNVSLVTDLPTLLTNNKLIFKNAGDSNCDKNISTVVDLSKGIPKQFFRKCKEDKGDIYVLSSAGFEQEKVQD